MPDLAGVEAVKAARDAVIIAALRVAAVERMLATDEKAAGTLAKADATLDLACRDLTNTIDDLPHTARPKGWELTPDGRTA